MDVFFRAYSLLEEAAFLHNYTKAQELVALAYLVCVYFFSVVSNMTKSSFISSEHLQYSSGSLNYVYFKHIVSSN